MVKLLPMDSEDYMTWRAAAVKDYAEDKIASGNWTPEEALELSEKEFNGYLPEGTATKDSYLLLISDESTGEKVGVVWLAVTGPPNNRGAFIYDFRILEPFRRKGYGTHAMFAIEDKVRELGLGKIGLHVFGHNHNAIGLYRKVGYTITNINMEKKLGDAPAS